MAKRKLSLKEKQRLTKVTALKKEAEFLKEARKTHKENKLRVSHKVKANPKTKGQDYDPQRFDMQFAASLTGSASTDKMRRRTVALESQGMLGLAMEQNNKPRISGNKSHTKEGSWN